MRINSHSKFIYRNPAQLVETVTFSTIGKLQPFLVSITSSALIVMDVHCALSHSEVVGYLAGTWDSTSNGKSSKLFLIEDARYKDF